MAGVTIRQAGLPDLEEAAAIFDEYRQFYGQPSDVHAAGEFLSARIVQKESIFFLANDGAQVVGFTQLFPAFSSVSMARTFILNDLFVRPEGRRRGTAKRLLSAAEGFAKEAGAVRLTLSTAITNEQAQALYRTSGWKQDDQFYLFHRALTL